MGIPSNDGKQQNILGGLMGCGAKCACPCCTSPREDFKKMGERLFALMEASGYDSQDFPHTLHELREGGKSTTECAKEYLKWMDNNRMTATEEQKKHLKEICACVVRIPLIHEPPCKFVVSLSMNLLV